MPELYLFGAIILTIAMVIFWFFLVGAKLFTHATERAEAPVASPKAKNQNWSYLGDSDSHGYLQVEDDQIEVFGIGTHYLDNRVTFSLFSTRLHGIEAWDVLLDGVSLQDLVPHHPARENREFMAFALDILKEAVRANSLPQESYDRAKQTWEALKSQDQLMRLGHIKVITHDTHYEFVWKA